MRNTAYGAREGESKSLPREEGFRVRVTCTQKVRGVYSLRMRDNPQIDADAQQVCLRNLRKKDVQNMLLDILVFQSVGKITSRERKRR